MIKAQKIVKSSELTREEENLLKDDLNVSCINIVAYFQFFALMKEWQTEMAKKMDHVTSHDDDLPPIRSGHVSMTKPTVSVRALNVCFRTRAIFKIYLLENNRLHLVSQMVPGHPVSNRVTTNHGINTMLIKSLLPWKPMVPPHQRAHVFPSY